MDSSLQQLPGYQVNEYKIVLVPHQELANKIKEIRTVFNERLKIEKPISSVPEVILTTFKQHQMNEERIINRLKIIAMAQPEIKVEIKDFGSFPTHSIFLNVTSKVPLSLLVKSVSSNASALLKLNSDKTPHFFKDFYIAIVRRLKPWQYEEGWKEFEHKNFTGRFIASRMLLMRRKEGEFKYKPIETFDFQNLPVDTVQGSLF